MLLEELVFFFFDVTNLISVLLSFFVRVPLLKRFASPRVFSPHLTSQRCQHNTHRSTQDRRTSKPHTLMSPHLASPQVLDAALQELKGKLAVLELGAEPVPSSSVAASVAVR
jgi:hypothetical protein